jgi:hypothetical protein
MVERKYIPTYIFRRVEAFFLWGIMYALHSIAVWIMIYYCMVGYVTGVPNKYSADQQTIAKVTKIQNSESSSQSDYIHVYISNTYYTLVWYAT